MLKRLSIVAVGVVLASDPVAALNLRANQKATGLFFADTVEATQAAHDASVTKLNDAIGSLNSQFAGLDTEREAFYNKMDGKHEDLNSERTAFETANTVKQATWETKIQEMQNKLTNDEQTFRDNEGEIVEAFHKAQNTAHEEAQAKIDAELQASHAKLNAEMQASSDAFTKKEATRQGAFEAATIKAHKAMGDMPSPDAGRQAFDEKLHSKMMALNDETNAFNDKHVAEIEALNKQVNDKHDEVKDLGVTHSAAMDALHEAEQKAEVQRVADKQKAAKEEAQRLADEEAERVAEVARVEAQRIAAKELAESIAKKEELARVVKAEAEKVEQERVALKQAAEAARAAVLETKKLEQKRLDEKAADLASVANEATIEAKQHQREMDHQAPMKHPVVTEPVVTDQVVTDQSTMPGNDFTGEGGEITLPVTVPAADSMFNDNSAAMAADATATGNTYGTAMPSYA